MEGDSEKGETTWSFDAAIRLLHIPLIAGRSATRDSDRPIVQPATAISTYRIPESGLVDASTNSLGDFDRLFETLGLAPTSSLPVPPLTSDDDSISSTGDTTRLSRVINEPNTALDKELQISLDRLAGIHEECDSSTARTLGPTLDERNRAIKVKGKKKAIQEQVETKLYTVNEPSFATPAEKKRIRKSKHSEGVESRQNLQNVAQSKSRARLYPETPTKTSTKTPNNSTNHTAFSPHQSRLIQNGEQKQHLLHKLWNQFESDRTTLFDYTSQLRGSTDATGIHIFVDMSNILIGFHDSLKHNLGLPRSERLPRQTLSFHNLSLILERGRPTAKRVIVGSDNVDSTIEAKLIGYETNILEKVTKSKPFSPSKSRRRGETGGSSGSDSGPPIYGPAKRVEQGVDEILHLKMCESIIDSEAPSTMVLATGDAAEAEYSAGFLKMVDRALQRDWKVEIVAFRENTASAYRNREWTSRWGASFKTIELDDYTNYLWLRT